MGVVLSRPFFVMRVIFDVVTPEILKGQETPRKSDECYYEHADLLVAVSTNLSKTQRHRFLPRALLLYLREAIESAATAMFG